MKKLVVTALVAAILSTVLACGWWNSGGSQTVVNQGGQEMACILAQVEAGNTDPISVGLACVGSLLTNLVKNIESILAFYTQPPPAPSDGGAAAVADLEARSGATGTVPPYQGAPTWLSGKTLANLRAMRDQAKAAIAAGAK